MLRGVALSLLLAVAGCSSPSTTMAPALPGVPSTAACSGDAGACIFGTAAAVGFVGSPVLTVNLYRVFPSGSFQLVQQQLVASQLVAADGTWAFSGREAW